MIKVAKKSSWVIAVLCILGFFTREVEAQGTVGNKPPVGQVAASAAEAKIEIAYTDGKLTADLKNAEIKDVLMKIGQAVNAQVEIGVSVAGKVTTSFQNLSLEDGISNILAAIGEKNVAMEYTKKPGEKKDAFKIEKISVLRKSTILEPNPGEIQAAIQKRDQEYRELFTKMDKERNKIARTLKEYVDPKTSAEKKLKLRTYFRQTTIDEPEDKLLLKGASLNPQYKEILDDMEMALLHAIQDKPEASDKEYILDLLRKGIPPGWLCYGMLVVWDDRYVPYLLEYVKKGGTTAMEILGRAKVKEAVPVLEKALDDKSEAVRMSAYYALLEITGKRYEYKRIMKETSSPQSQGGR